MTKASTEDVAAALTDMSGKHDSQLVQRWAAADFGQVLRIGRTGQSTNSHTSDPVSPGPAGSRARGLG